MAPAVGLEPSLEHADLHDLVPIATTGVDAQTSLEQRGTELLDRAVTHVPNSDPLDAVIAFCLLVS